MIQEYENKATGAVTTKGGKNTRAKRSSKNKKGTVVLKQFIVTPPGKRPKSVLAENLADAESKYDKM